MAYPYSKAETLADAAVHLAGLALAIPGSVVLVLEAAKRSEALGAGTAVYAGCLILALLASAVYHMCPLDRLRPTLARIDHAAIYFKIAASYVPFVVIIGSVFAYSVLGAVWALAIGGAIAKLSFWGPGARGSLALYLGMGWLSALLIWPMSQEIAPEAVILVVFGGLVYSAGTRVYAHPGMPYQNAIWHAIVLSASICLFAAVSLAL